MKKSLIIFFLLCVIILSSCKTLNNDNSTVSTEDINVTETIREGAYSIEIIKDKSYVYDSTNIILCEEVPNYGFIELSQRPFDGYIPSFKERIRYKRKVREQIVDSYTVSDEYPDFVVSGYKDGVAIVNYTGKDKNIIIPETIDGKAVIKLGGYIELDRGDDGSLYNWYHSAISENQAKTIHIPKTVKDIALNFFHSNADETLIYKDTSNCTLERITVDGNNPYYSSENGLLYSRDKKVLLCVPENYKDEAIVIPEGVKTVYEFFCQNTKSVSFPASTEKITSFIKDTFLDNGNRCMNYTYKEIPLKSISVNNDNNYYMSKDGNLYNKDGAEILCSPVELSSSKTETKKVSLDELNIDKYLKKMKKPGVYCVVGSRDDVLVFVGRDISENDYSAEVENRVLKICFNLDKSSKKDSKISYKAIYVSNPYDVNFERLLVNGKPSSYVNIFAEEELLRSDGKT